MMWNGYGMGMGWGWLFMVLLLIGIVLLAIVLVRSTGSSPDPRGRGSQHPGPETGTHRAEQILAELFARGEIDGAEYDDRIRRLRES